MRNLIPADFANCITVATPWDIAWQYGINIDAVNLGQIALEPILDITVAQGHTAWGNSQTLWASDSYSSNWDNHFQDLTLVHMQTAHAVYDLYQVSDNDSVGFYSSTPMGSVWGGISHSDSFTVLSGHSTSSAPALTQDAGLSALLPFCGVNEYDQGDSFKFVLTKETQSNTVYGGQTVETPWGPLTTSFSVSSYTELSDLDAQVGDTLLTKESVVTSKSASVSWELGDTKFVANSFFESSYSVTHASDPHGVSPEIAYLHTQYGLLG